MIALQITPEEQRALVAALRIAAGVYSVDALTFSNGEPQLAGRLKARVDEANRLAAKIENEEPS